MNRDKLSLVGAALEAWEFRWEEWGRVLVSTEQLELVVPSSAVSAVKSWLHRVSQGTCQLRVGTVTWPVVVVDSADLV